MMLQHLEYGTGTPSSVAPLIHPEDAQPNEQVNRRNRNIPPRVASTTQPTRGNSNFRGRGGYRGRGMSHGWTQYAVRGRRGTGSQSNRGGHSSSRNQPILEHWSVTEARRSAGGGMILDPTMPLGASAQSASPSSSSSSWRSRNADDRSRSLSGWYPDKESVPAKRRYSPTPYVSLSQTSATPPAPETSRSWMVRSRSPTPKLPPCPIKRRKLDHISDSHDDPSAGILPGRHLQKSFVAPPTTPEIVVNVKEEAHSPTPPPLPQPKLVTDSCEFYPLPEFCKKSNPDYQVNRRKFFQEKNRYLIGMGLKKTKVFYRDDGLVIEWTSKIPVWSDTLQPDIRNLATAIQLAHTINGDLASPTKRKTQISSQGTTDEPPSKKISSGLSKGSRKTNISGIKTHWAAGLQEDQVEIMSRLGSSARKPSATIPPIQPKSQVQVPKAKMVLPTRRNGALLKPPSASAAPTHVIPVAFSPRDSGFGTRLSSVPPPAMAARAASPTPTPAAVVDSSGPKRMTFKPTLPSRRKDLPQAPSNSSSSIPPILSAEAAGPSPASSSRRSATPASTTKSQDALKSGLPGAAVAGSIRHPVVLKHTPKPHLSASSAPFAGSFEPVGPVAQRSDSNSAVASRLTSLILNPTSDSDLPSIPRRADTRELEIKEEEVVQQVEWEHRLPTPAPTTADLRISPGLAGTTSTPKPTALSGTSLSGRSSQVPDIIPRKSTTPSPASLPRSRVDVQQPSPRHSLPTPSIGPEGRVRSSVSSERGKEKTKDQGIEGEPTADINLGDADYIAQELLGRSLDPHEDKDLEGRERVEPSTGGEDEEEEGDELVALSTEYLQRYIHFFDTNRSKLDLAYAEDALFSCQVHHLQGPSSSTAELFLPEVEPSLPSTHADSPASTSVVVQGRQQINDTLLKMGPYQFGARGVSGTVYYDAVLFGSGSGAGDLELDTTNDNVLVTMHGEVVNVNGINPELDHVLTVDQSFVLRRKRGIEEISDDGASAEQGGLAQKDTRQVWPLVAISHQMTVRAAPLLAAEKLEELLPWIQDIL